MNLFVMLKHILSLEVSQWPNNSSEKFISWEITSIKQETRFLQFSCYTSVYSASINKYKWTTNPIHIYIYKPCTPLITYIFKHFYSAPTLPHIPTVQTASASSNRAELNKQATVSSSLAAKSSFLYRDDWNGGLDDGKVAGTWRFAKEGTRLGK